MTVLGTILVALAVGFVADSTLGDSRLAGVFFVAVASALYVTLIRRKDQP